MALYSITVLMCR